MKSTVTISPTFQVVIPRDVRRQLGLEPGQKLEVLAYDGRIELIPLRPISEMRGFLGGIDSSIDRDRDRK